MQDIKQDIKTIMLMLAVVGSASAFAAESGDDVMSCGDLATKLKLEATGEAKARFKDLEGSCQSVVRRNGELYMKTAVVVRRVRGNTITLYVPATDRTFDVDVANNARVVVAGRKVRPRDLVRNQEMNIYVSVAKFMQPMIDEVAFETEADDIVVAPAVIAPALPTTG